MDEPTAAVAAYATKRVEFRFRSKTIGLSLSHALFSSADVDSGTRFLLRVVSRFWDEDTASGRPLPASVLDAGCGVGVIGIAAAAALRSEGVQGLRVRAQDRDALAAAFTVENARTNGIGGEVLAAYAEPLLEGPEGARWDLILSNIPAKAGSPVLEDFFLRSTALLAPSGRAFVVIVNTLAEAARDWMEKAGAELFGEEQGPEHTVFVYRRREAVDTEDITAKADPLAPGAGGPFPLPPRAYVRTAGAFSLEGTPYRIEAVHGVADFDEPGRPVVLAAKLLAKQPPLRPGPDGTHRAGVAVSALVHESDQGHFPAWLAARAAAAKETKLRVTLAGRNALALAASRANVLAAASAAKAAAAVEGDGSAAPEVRTTAAIDLGIAAERLLAEGGPFDLVASFPEAVPRVDRNEDTWRGVERLLARGGLFLVAQSSTEIGRLDRCKPKGFTRVADIKRDGFSARLYRKD